MKNLIYILFITFPIGLFSQNTGKININFPYTYYDFDYNQWPVHIIIHPHNSMDNDTLSNFSYDIPFEDYELPPGLYDLKTYYSTDSDDILWHTIHKIEILENNTNYITINGVRDYYYDWSNDSLDTEDLFFSQCFKYGPIPG